MSYYGDPSKSYWNISNRRFIDMAKRVTLRMSDYPKEKDTKKKEENNNEQTI